MTDSTSVRARLDDLIGEMTVSHHDAATITLDSLALLADEMDKLRAEMLAQIDQTDDMVMDAMSKINWLDAVKASKPASDTPACDSGDGGSVTLADCPVGLFWCDKTLCVKSEYGTNEGRIDAFIVSSGEFFWGGPPQTIASQRATLVTPVETNFAERVLQSAPDITPAMIRAGVDELRVSLYDSAETQVEAILRAALAAR